MDTKYLTEALQTWQEKNHTGRGFRDLTPSQQSEIMRDAQELKKADSRRPLTIDDVLESRRSF